MKILEINIKDEGEHWYKEIRLFGLLMYARHDYTKYQEKRPIGFQVFPDSIVEVVEEEFYPDECENHHNKIENK